MTVKPYVLAIALVLGLAFIGCGGSEQESSALGVKTGTCSDVVYEGSGKPDALIVSDLPMRGGSAERSRQQVAAIRLALKRQGYKAGSVRVGFQSCDDSIASTGLWDRATCKANAEAYAANRDVLGVIGTYNSGCAAIEIPILNRASLAIISPGNTNVCLTEASPLCSDYSPTTLYTKRRNYLRVVPNDAYQGAGLAEFARNQGVRRPYILYAADDPTSTGQAANFRGAAEHIGLTVAGYRTWDPNAKSYTDQWQRVRASGADGAVLAGLIEQNGAKLIRDKVAVLGANSKVKLFAFDGFAQQSTIDSAGPAAVGMFASIPGQSTEDLAPPGRDFAAELAASLKKSSVEVFAPYGGEAAQVLLAAIAKAGTDRAKIIEALFATVRTNGILGSYRFESSGDPSAGPVTVFRASRTFKSVMLVAPSLASVAAARAGS